MDRENFENAVRAFLMAEPFRPFVVELVSGRKAVIASASDLALRGGLAVGFHAGETPVMFDHAGVAGLRLVPPEPAWQARVRAEVTRLRRADPFRPFVLELADGRRLSVEDSNKVGGYDPDRSAAFHFGDYARLYERFRFADVVRIVVPGAGADVPAVVIEPEAGKEGRP